MIDEIDRKIIKELDKNSRITNSKIAKKVKISKQVLNYRLQKLIDKKIIGRFYTVVNGVKFGYMYVRVYLKFQKLTFLQESKLVENFIKNPYVTWVVKCRGSWDLVVSVYAKDTDQFVHNYQKIVENFEDKILNKKIDLMQNVLFSSRDYLQKNPDKSSVYVYGGITKFSKKDELDHKILKQLSKNCRIKLVEFAKKLNTTPDTIKSRIKKLENEGIIKSHRLLLNYSKLGFLFFILSINLHNTSKKARIKVEKYCTSCPNTVYLVNLLGDHEMDLEMEFETQEQLDKFIRNLQNKFSDIIRDIEVIQITKQKKIGLLSIQIIIEEEVSIHRLLFHNLHSSPNVDVLLAIL